MKKILLLALFAACTTLPLQAQDDEKKEIERVILQYIENFFENKFEPMNEALHPRLAKRGLNPDRTMSEDFPPLKLKDLMSKKRPLPLDRQKNTVSNIQVFRNSATASLETGYPNLRWMEYIHMVKMDGKWQLINVFWEYFE